MWKYFLIFLFFSHHICSYLLHTPPFGRLGRPFGPDGAFGPAVATFGRDPFLKWSLWNHCKNYFEKINNRELIIIVYISLCREFSIGLYLWRPLRGRTGLRGEAPYGPQSRQRRDPFSSVPSANHSTSVIHLCLFISLSTENYILFLNNH